MHIRQNEAQRKKEIKLLKEIIKQKDENKYNQLLKKEDSSMFSVNWYEEANILQDSLRMDSIAKTNYALGMQAVRDSLANANKK